MITTVKCLLGWRAGTSLMAGRGLLALSAGAGSQAFEYAYRSCLTARGYAVQ